MTIGIKLFNLNNSYVLKDGFFPLDYVILCSPNKISKFEMN